MENNSVDICTCIFFLSALAPSQFGSVTRNIVRSVKGGGLVYFRDYGVYDLAMRRFAKKGSRVEKGVALFRRGDGTLAYFFTKQEVLEIFEKSAEKEGSKVEVVDLKYVCVRLENKKKNLKLHRIFVSALLRILK